MAEMRKVSDRTVRRLYTAIIIISILSVGVGFSVYGFDNPVLAGYFIFTGLAVRWLAQNYHPEEFEIWVGGSLLSEE